MSDTVTRSQAGRVMTDTVVKDGAGVIESQRNDRTHKRNQHAEDLVGPVYFPALPDGRSHFISGQMLNVVGGMVMNRSDRRRSPVREASRGLERAERVNGRSTSKPGRTSRVPPDHPGGAPRLRKTSPLAVGVRWAITGH
jgi:hypothetical protein